MRGGEERREEELTGEEGGEIVRGGRGVAGIGDERRRPQRAPRSWPSPCFTSSPRGWMDELHAAP